MRGPDTSADVYVWPVWCGLSTENKQNRQKLLNSSEISRFRSLKNRAGLKISENPREGPGVMGSPEVYPSTPNCMGYVKIHFSQKKNDFVRKKPKKIPIFIRHFLNDQWS